MEDRKVVVKRTGITFLDILTIAFIVLKLCGVITWSWVWVLAPLWIPIALIIIIVFIVWLVYFIRDRIYY
jgi:hypothetical protein